MWIPSFPTPELSDQSVTHAIDQIEEEDEEEELFSIGYQRFPPISLSKTDCSPNKVQEIPTASKQDIESPDIRPQKKITSRLQNSFQDYITTKKKHIFTKWTQEAGDDASLQSELQCVRTFTKRREPRAEYLNVPKKVELFVREKSPEYSKKSPQMPKHPSAWLEKQLQIPSEERLSIPRPTVSLEKTPPRTTRKSDWEAFVDRQIGSEKVRKINQSIGQKKSRPEADSPAFERLYNQSLRTRCSDVVDIPSPKEGKKKITTVWSNDPRWMKPRTIQEPMDMTTCQTETTILEKSKQLTQGKPSLQQRSKRDFKDMIDEYRETVRDGRTRNDYFQQSGE
jgi:hypothetical protein